MTDEITTIPNRELIRKELETIANRKAGLTPQTLLHVAKNPKSILHSHFEWDDTEAARKYRIAQAYNLIRTVSVQVEVGENKTVNVRAFVPVKRVLEDGTVETGQGHYIPITRAMSEEETRRQVLGRAKMELLSFQSKYSAFTELAGVNETISQAILMLENRNAELVA